VNCALPDPFHGMPILQFRVAWQGYVIYSVKQKLKAEYVGISGKEIQALKASGVQVHESSDPFHSPAYFKLEVRICFLFSRWIVFSLWSTYQSGDLRLGKSVVAGSLIRPRSRFIGLALLQPFQSSVTNYLILSGHWIGSNSWGCIYGRYYIEFLSGRS